MSKLVCKATPQLRKVDECFYKKNPILVKKKVQPTSKTKSSLSVIGCASGKRWRNLCGNSKRKLASIRTIGLKI